VKKAIAAAAVAALIAGAAGAVAVTKTKDVTSRCVVPSGAETLVVNNDVRVYSRDKGYGDNAFKTGIYACRYSTGKRIALGTAYVRDDENVDSGPIRYIRDISLSDEAGGTTPAVAYVDTNCIKDPCKLEVVVRSLGDGKVMRRFKAGSPFDYVELSVPTDQDGIAIAWMETSAGGSCDGGCRVHLIKNSGDKILDEGTDIESDTFGTLANDHPGIIHSLGTNDFVWKRGSTLKMASFND
jgi:hypothetical protein